MKINEKISELRLLMKKNNLQAWIVNGTDPHNSEYVCPRWRTREWITGFTGSSGFVVITSDDAVLWVDSRYYFQAAEQIKGTYVRMLKIDGPDAVNPLDFICSLFPNNERIGIAAETLTVKEQRKMSDKKLNIIAMDDLLNKIWKDRPAVPSTSVEELPVEICGESVKSKMERVRKAMKERKCTITIISSLDDIAWTLNLRADDVKNSPFLLSFLIIREKDAVLFTSLSRFKKNNVKPCCYTVKPYEDISDYVKTLSPENAILLNPDKTNMNIYNSINSKCCIVEEMEPTTNFKARKNDVEIEGEILSHITDGIAMVNFLAKVKKGNRKFTELSLAALIDGERRRRPEFVDLSFGTIAGWAHHGAMCHYSATEETSIPIEGNGLVVLDSGGHYKRGTTDITRTLLFGKATEEQIRDYTLVLKGHLALANQKFPAGTNGYQMDILAKQFMWQEGLTFYHGTGHGVGFRLSVHEGPAAFSCRPYAAEAPIELGMVISDEPGLYKEGRHGIRIENLLYIKKDIKTEFGQFYSMEFLTLCPYERDLINVDMLSNQEIKMINEYNKKVYETLTGKVDPEAEEYLRAATEPLNGDK